MMNHHLREGDVPAVGVAAFDGDLLQQASQFEVLVRCST
jgi:diketogulonate reductase-like aldo/keto reductase